MRYHRRWILGLLLPWAAQAQPIFDVHLHYRSGDIATIGQEAVLERMAEHSIERAVIIGQPPELALELYRLAPERIVPFYGVYRSREEKESWHRDTTLPERVERALEQQPWRGLGELHLFADQRNSPVFHRLIALADEHDLVMMIHGDPAVIDALYTLSPRQPVIWAHAGAYPYPELLRDYLGRYPALYIDLSVRNARIAPEGEISEAWYRLLLEYPDRFLLGVDTFSRGRWQRFGEVVAQTRHWLGQLPAEVAGKLAHGNARRLFAGR